MKDGEYVTVETYSDAMSAHITKGMLLENGIPAVVFGEVSSYPALNAAHNNIELKVFAKDYDAAMELLKMNSSEE